LRPDERAQYGAFRQEFVCALLDGLEMLGEDVTQRCCPSEDPPHVGQVCLEIPKRSDELEAGDRIDVVEAMPAVRQLCRGDEPFVGVVPDGADAEPSALCNVAN